MQLDDQKVMSAPIIDKIRKSAILAVIVLDNLNHTKPLIEALLQGGVNTIELTLRTPIALHAAKIIKKEYPEILLGFGTVLTKEQVNKVIDVGADFAVSPGCNPKIISEAKRLGLFFAPGIMTPTDIEIAIEEGCKILKYFPAETSGGMKHLRSMAAPYQYLGLEFIPLGGVNISNVRNYLESPEIIAVGGSWVAKRNLIQEENWNKITSNAKEVTSIINQINNLT